MNDINRTTGIVVIVLILLGMGTALYFNSPEGMTEEEARAYYTDTQGVSHYGHMGDSLSIVVDSAGTLLATKWHCTIDSTIFYLRPGRSYRLLK